MRRGKILALFLFCILLFFSTSSCTVLMPANNGQHKGWFKNPRNPHNPRYHKTIKPFKSDTKHVIIINDNNNKSKKKAKKNGKHKKK